MILLRSFPHSITVTPLAVNKLIWPVCNLLFASRYALATLNISSSLVCFHTIQSPGDTVCVVGMPRFLSSPELSDLSIYFCLGISTRHLRLNIFQAEGPIFLLLIPVNDNSTCPVALAQISVFSLTFLLVSRSITIRQQILRAQLAEPIHSLTHFLLPTPPLPCLP